MGWEPKSRPRSSNWSSMAWMSTTTSVTAVLIAGCLAAAGCTGGAQQAQNSPATRPSGPQPTPHGAADGTVQVTSQTAMDCKEDVCVVVKVMNTGTAATAGICGPWLPHKPPPSIGIPGTYKRIGLLQPGASQDVSFAMRHLKELGVNEASTVQIRCVSQNVDSEASSTVTFTIKHAGTHVYPWIAPGDEVKCIAGGGGGIVPQPGEGVGGSSGFRAWTDADGTVHVTCPNHLAGGNI